MEPEVEKFEITEDDLENEFNPHRRGFRQTKKQATFGECLEVNIIVPLVSIFSFLSICIVIISKIILVNILPNYRYLGWI